MFSYLVESLGTLMTIHQAGVNMIPQFGWRQAIEAWSYSKLEEQ